MTSIWSDTANERALSAPCFQTMAEALRWRARYQAERLAYNFLLDGETIEAKITYGELDARARAVARLLEANRARHEHVLLLYPPGLDYIAALFGCLYAGAVAVPAYPPGLGRAKRSLARLQAITANSKARFALTTASILETVPELLVTTPRLGVPHWFATDALAPAAPDGADFEPEPESLALLQYTSGSTAAPKGVMITHANVTANQHMAAEAFGTSSNDVAVGWLPFYHDMGLIGNVFHTTYVGCSIVLMSPLAFLQRPLRWLRAISRYRATVSGGPNFAYELCVQHVDGQELASLDLASWNTAFNGAEPVRADTLERFAAKFAACGFRREAFHPCYGLAEATLIVTGATSRRHPVLRPAPGGAAPGHAPRVGCGSAIGRERVLIVDPATLAPCESGREGEIWVDGPNVASGYWGCVAESERTFRARLANGEGLFLRTGDLGILDGTELYVTGRMKDLVIVRGRNLYPQDVELTVERAHPAVRRGCVVAFAAAPTDDHDGEGLGVAAEIGKLDGADEIEAACRAIIAAVTEEHEVAPCVVALLARGGLPRTSSGKLQRQAVRATVAAGTIEALHVWRGANDTRPMAARTPLASPVPRERPENAPSSSQSDVRRLVLEWLCQRLGMQPTSIDPAAALSSYGLGSLDAVTLAGFLEQQMDRRISPSVVYDHPTVDKLVTHLTTAIRPTAVISRPVLAPREAPPMADEPIAIIGLGCRVPGAADPAGFWRLLASGADLVGQVPPSRFDIARWYDPVPTRGRTYVMRAAMLDRIDEFDAAFFGISASEAAGLDPQQRFLLEVTWEALEHAGLAPESLAGMAAGVFVGMSTSDYGATLALSRPERIDVYAGTGTARSAAAGRLSYLLGVHGPSMAVDTACSSSLVAVHLGCQSLRSGESDLAIAGGVSLIVSPQSFIYLSQLHALAPDGRCKTFDEAADGYGRGEGCGIVVLKRLRDALAAGDTPLAVIRGSAVNQDGATNGLTAPSGAAQQAVIRAALARAGASPEQIDYVEAHGTGTALGDLIEVEALGNVMCGRTAPLHIGSVKTNIGHLEAAAGVVGLIKTVLALQHEQIPPHIHLHKPNPRIAWSALPFDVPHAPIAWPRGVRPRLAGVSSFGLSGTNAHVVVAEPPPIAAPRPPFERPAAIVAWSASSREALAEMGSRLSNWMAAHQQTSTSDVAASLAHARTGRRLRAAVVARDAELRARLAQVSTTRLREHRESGAPPRVGFLFTGQGSHHAAMGVELDRFETPFRRALDRCAAVLDGRLARPLRTFLFEESAAAQLRETRLAQPVLLSLQYALVELWRAWGIEPVAVLGHSIGEVAAACTAGVLSIEDALLLVAERGRLIDECCPRGAMIGAAATERRVRRAIADHQAENDVAIASLNAPDHVVFSGDEAQVMAIGEELASEGIRLQRLDVSHAFHSSHMDPALAPFTDVAARIAPRRADIAFVSTRTGRILESTTALDAGYWVAQLREPVRFAEAARSLATINLDALIEVGPQATLLALHQRAEPDSHALRLPSLDRSGAACQRMLASLAELYQLGANVRWGEVVGPKPSLAPRLPTYPFQRERFWLEDTPVRDAVGASEQQPRPAIGDRSAPRMSDGEASLTSLRTEATPQDRSAISSRLREIVGDLLRVPPHRVDEGAQLADMGADSIIVINGLQRIQQETGVRIPLREVFNGLGTIDRLTDYIVSTHSQSTNPTAMRAVDDGVGRTNGSTPTGRSASAPSPTTRQLAHLARFALRYNERTAGSKRRKSKAHPVLADPRLAAGYRATLPTAHREMWRAAKDLAYPIVGARSKGSRIWDVDGNEYIDFTMGFGVHLFGHAAPFVVEAVQDELRRGAQIGPQSDHADEAAELIRELTGVERLAFCSTGTEAVMAAVRLARAKVGRPRIAAFAGSYHGSYDGVLPVIPLTHGVPAAVDADMLLLEYGNPRSLELIEANASALSAVLVEPVQSRRPELQPREFLHALRELTCRHGIALIFDEVLVGFRIGPSGAQAYFDVQADLVTYGKIVGGGLPIGVVAGRAEYLDGVDGGAWTFGDASVPETEPVWLAGTFNKNPLTMAASVAVLRRLRSEGPSLQERLNERTSRVVRQLREEFVRTRAPIEPVHFGSLLRLHMPHALDLFYPHLIEQGIYVWEGRSMFLSTEHSEQDTERLVETVRRTLSRLEEGGFLTDAAARVPTPSGRDGKRSIRWGGASSQENGERPLLFCFPYAGGSSAAFLRWPQHLGDVAEVVPVALPGRDARVAESPATDYDRVIESLSDEISRPLRGSGRPFALFGHSMGALLAYGVARKLFACGLCPNLLLISGESAPHIVRHGSGQPAHLLDDAGLLDAMAGHGITIDPRASKLIERELVLLRADLALCHGFRHRNAEPLGCRIVAFAGDCDTLSPEHDVAAWARHTHAGFTLHVLPGDHFFFRSQSQALLDLIATELNGQTAHGIEPMKPPTSVVIGEPTRA
jgi:iturin family lipopeptide synthetase A